MRFERRQGKTVLGQCRFKLPLQALTSTELADGTAYLLLLNPTGGLVGGDVLRTHINLQDDTRVCLSTPSATRVYRTFGETAVQETWIQVGERALLEYIPDHVIPHRDSKLRQTLRVEMGRGSCAILWDAVAAGRIAHGERWNFGELDSRTEIFANGRPVFLNRTLICPARLDSQEMGFAGEFNYLATLVIVAKELSCWPAMLAAMNAALDNLRQVYGGVSLLTGGGCAVKLLARSACDLARAQTALWGSARAMVFGSPTVDLRKY